MKASKYLHELDVILNCLAVTEAEQDQYLSAPMKKRLTNRLKLYRASPAAKEKLLDTYNRIKIDQYKKHATDPTDARRELLDEPAVTIAKGFLLRYVEGPASEAGEIPGFQSRGKIAGRKLLRTLSEKHPKKRRVSDAPPG